MQNFKKKLNRIRQEKLIICKKIVSFFLLFNISILSANALIVDDFAEATLDKNLKIKIYSTPFVQEELPLSDGIIKSYSAKISENDRIAVRIRAVEDYSTRHRVEEGSYFDFVTVENIKLSNNTYLAGTIVKGRVENVSYNSNWGIPADLVVGNFSMQGTSLSGEINKTGANRTLWVKPLSIFLTPFFGASICLLFIKGGHAKIKQTEEFLLYY